MNVREHIQMTDTLGALQSRGDKFTRQLLQEKQRIAQLQAQLKEVNDEVSLVRSLNKKRAIELLNIHSSTTNNAYQRADGTNPTRLAQINQEKLVNNLEGRLNKAFVRRSTIHSENNLIKTKVDKLRQKVHNDSINRKHMEKKLKSIQNEVEEIMKTAATISEQREKVIEKSNHLIRENMEERDKFNEEYSKLANYISEQNRLLETSISMVASNIENNLKKVETDEAENIKEESKNPREEIRSLDERIEELNNQCEASKRILKQTEEKNKSYHEAFQELQEVSGLSSTNDIINAFVKNEDESFSLFNYIQTMDQESDRLNEENMALKKEIETYTKDQRKQEHHRLCIVDDYKRRLHEAKEERQKLTDANKEGKNTVLQIAKNVQLLYIRLRCRELESRNEDNKLDTAKFKESSSSRIQADRKLTMISGEQISEHNILHHMEVIERRAMQIIAEYARTLAGNRRVQRRPSILLVRQQLGVILVLLSSDPKFQFLTLPKFSHLKALSDQFLLLIPLWKKKITRILT